MSLTVLGLRALLGNVVLRITVTASAWTTTAARRAILREVTSCSLVSS